MKLTTKILGYLHRIFNTDPDQFLAFRLAYDGALAWKVENGFFYSSVVGGSGVSLTIDLSQYSLVGFATFLSLQSGYQVLDFDFSRPQTLSALVLMDSAGDLAIANQERVCGYSNWLHAYAGAQSVELSEAKQQVENMLDQMNVVSANNEWLDVHGSYFGVPRLIGELDAQYSARIIAQVLRPKSNNVALEAAIFAYSGQVTRVSDIIAYREGVKVYSARYNHDSAINYDATAEAYWGLFDVVTAYDLLGSTDLTQFIAIVHGIIGAQRAAGTQMHSIALQTSVISDAAPFPSDAFSFIVTTSGVDAPKEVL